MTVSISRVATALVFYWDEQTVRVADSSSRSPEKPAQVVADWERSFPGQFLLCAFEPVAREDWARVHDPAYVEAVWSLAVVNGFRTRSQAVNESLRFTSGSMVAAARHAWATRRSAVSPTSGFHHAGYGYGGGFCTFNGLCLAAQDPRSRLDIPCLAYLAMYIERQ